jgi:hypothetical protein
MFKGCLFFDGITKLTNKLFALKIHKIFVVNCRLICLLILLEIYWGDFGFGFLGFEGFSREFLRSPALTFS